MEIFELKTRLSKNLKKLRKEKNWSQFELAEKADLSEQTINSIESKRLWPSEKTIIKISNALNEDVSKLFIPEENSEILNKINNDLLDSLKINIQEIVNNTIQNFYK